MELGSGRGCAVPNQAERHPQEYASDCRPLIEPQTRDDARLGLTTPSFFRESSYTGKNEVKADNERKRRVYSPYPDQEQAYPCIPQDGVERGGM